MPATMDGLADGDPLVITREVFLEVGFVLAVRPGTSLSAVRSVASHPHALAQTVGRLAELLPDVVPLPTSSTAGAAEAVAAGKFDAAVCAPIAARPLRPGAAGRGPRRPARGGHPVRAGRPARQARAADRQRQDVAGGRRRRPHRGAAGAAQRVRRPRDLADPHRVAPDPRAARRLLLLPRLRGPHRRPPGGRGAGRAAPGVRRRPLPRLLPAGRRPGEQPVPPVDGDEAFEEAAAWLEGIRTGRCIIVLWARSACAVSSR